MRPADRLRLILLAAPLGAVLLFAASAFAQGSGIFLAAPGTGRPACTSITNPVTNRTWCMDGNSPPTIKMWGGSSYTDVAGLTGTNTEPGASADCVNPDCGNWSTRLLEMSNANYAANNSAALYVSVKQDAAGGGVLPWKTGIVVDAYNPPDNGGDVSGIWAVQGGGGNAASFFKASQEWAPAGQTKYPNNGWALEVGTSDATAALFVNTDFMLTGTFGAQGIEVAVSNPRSKGILVVPRDGATFDARSAYAIGNLIPNSATNQDVHFQVLMSGHMALGRDTDGSHMLWLQDPSTTSAGQVLLDGSASTTGGVNIVMLGNGALTPSKTLRVFQGEFQIVNDAYDSILLSLSDAGALDIVATAPLAAQMSVTSTLADSNGANIKLDNQGSVVKYLTNLAGKLVVLGDSRQTLFEVDELVDTTQTTTSLVLNGTLYKVKVGAASSCAPGRCLYIDN